jgi:hypothetical protein
MSPVVRLVVIGAAMVGFFLPFFIFTVRKSEKAAVTAGAARCLFFLRRVADVPRRSRLVSRWY